MNRIDILLNYLRLHHYHMTSFLFHYNGVHYVVLFEDLDNLPLVNEGFCVLLTFIDVAAENRKLSVKANVNHFKFNVREFREFFRIAFAENLGDIFQQFYAYFNGFIPETINEHPTEQQIRLSVERLNRNDNDNNMCCYMVKRNPVVEGRQYHRSPFNDQKCRILKPDLYEHFKEETTISFCFREENCKLQHKNVKLFRNENVVFYRPTFCSSPSSSS